jgi:hypothetical protein
VAKGAETGGKHVDARYSASPPPVVDIIGTLVTQNFRGAKSALWGTILLGEVSRRGLC